MHDSRSFNMQNSARRAVTYPRYS